MTKFLGIIAWGVLVYSILNFLPVSYSSGTSFLASGKDTLLDSVKDSKNASRAISIFERDGKFLGGSLNYPGDVDIYGIKNSSKNQNLFFAATDKGLFVSRDGGLNWHNFSDIEKKIGENTKIYGLIFSPDGRAYISAYENNKGFLYTSNDNFFSLDKIADWDKEGVYSMSLTGDDLYLGLSDGRLLKYSLSGKGIGEVNKLKSPVIKLEVFGGNIYLVLKSGGFLAGNDSGKNFKSGDNNFKDFYADPRNPNLIYAITGYGLIRSADSGNTWQVLKNLPVEAKKVSALAIDFGRNEIFIASGDKAYRSADNGKNWGIFNLLLGNREVSIISPIDDKLVIGSRKSNDLFFSLLKSL